MQSTTQEAEVPVCQLISLYLTHNYTNNYHSTIITSMYYTNTHITHTICICFCLTGQFLRS